MAQGDRKGKVRWEGKGTTYIIWKPTPTKPEAKRTPQGSHYWRSTFRGEKEDRTDSGRHPEIFQTLDLP